MESAGIGFSSSQNFDVDGTANENDRSDCSNIHVSDVSTLFSSLQSFDGDGTANENDRDDCSNKHVSNVSTLH